MAAPNVNSPLFYARMGRKYTPLGRLADAYDGQEVKD
jgi:hypothetical protein